MFFYGLVEMLVCVWEGVCDQFSSCSELIVENECFKVEFLLMQCWVQKFVVFIEQNVCLCELFNFVVLVDDKVLVSELIGVDLNFFI